MIEIMAATTNLNETSILQNKEPIETEVLTSPPPLPAPNSLRRLSEENGEFLVSPYGKYLSWGFRGEKEFVERCRNMVTNFGVVDDEDTSKRKFHYAYRDEEGLGYILVDNKEAIVNVLKTVFATEITYTKEIPFKKEWFNDETQEWDVEFDDEAIDKLASLRAEEFFVQRIKKEDFMAKATQASDIVFGMSSFNRGGKWMEYGKR